MNRQVTTVQRAANVELSRHTKVRLPKPLLADRIAQSIIFCRFCHTRFDSSLDALKHSCASVEQ